MAIHESRSQFRKSGLLIAGGTQLENHWIGIVMNHGTKCPPCDLEFGDVVLLNRWAHSAWLFRTTPIGYESKKYLMRSEDGTRQFECTGADHWCFVEPDKIPFIVNTWQNLVAYNQMPVMLPGPHRVLVELINNPSAILNPEWSRAGKMMGRVLSGCRHVGQHVIVNPMRGIRYQEPPDYDRWFVSIHADYIEAVGSEEDFQNIKEVSAIWPN